MFKLTILLSTFLYASAAIFQSPNLSFIDESNDVSKITKFHLKKVDESLIRDVWVLSSNEGLDFRTLRKAGLKEQEVFERVVGPMIDAYKHRPARVVKSEPAKESGSENKYVNNERKNKKIKQEIMRLINKFVMSMKFDPDVFITDSASLESTGPSLILFIKGAYTSLSVSSDHKQWHFFLPPPSPLPAWLYEEHEATFNSSEEESTVNIPDYVRGQLYEKLLHLLNTLLGFPI